MKRLAIYIAILFLLLSPRGAYSICHSGAAVLFDICWECIFPFNMAGISIIPGISDNTLFVADNSGICVCPKEDCYPTFTGIGITNSYWAPNRAAETTKDPWCFPYYGIDFSSFSGGSLSGTVGGYSKGRNNTTSYTFAQAHWWQNLLWDEVIGEVIGNSICDVGGEKSDDNIDVGYFTELDPLWNDDSLAAIIEPEALLFANPVAQIACVADGVSSLMGQDLTPLFWCIGGSSAYPLSGAKSDANYVQANERLAARFIYKMARETLICDTALACGCFRFPIWWKSNYRIQGAKPVQDYTAHALGKSSILWGAGKNPPYAGDNFVWMIFRRATCCGEMICLSG